MKKMLIALEDEKTFEQMKKSGKYMLHEQDITYKEGVIEFLSKNKIDIIITKDSLQGEMTREIYIKQLRLIAPKLKIILFAEILDDIYKSFLFAQEIFNIIEEEITFRRLFEMLESEKYEVLYKENKNELKVNNLEIKKDIKIISKQIISVFGTSGSGKSYITSLLGQFISKILKINTLIVDMDIQNPAIDIYNNINGESNSLYYIMEDIDNNSFNTNTFRETINTVSGNKKLSFITNNLDIYECQNRLSSYYYKKLYKEAKEIFDVTIIDIPASPFLDIVPFSLMQSEKILFVINPNFISIRQAIKYLDLMVNVWNIDKKKIHIVINKILNTSLSEKQIQSMLRGYNFFINIENDIYVEQIINGGQVLDENQVKDVEKVANMLGINFKNNDKILSLKKRLNIRV